MYYFKGCYEGVIFCKQKEYYGVGKFFLAIFAFLNFNLFYSSIGSKKGEAMKFPVNNSDNL
jgi:hypothetical protein